MSILITRPKETGVALTDLLNKSGLTALHFPLFSITSGRELNHLPHYFSQLKSGDYVLAVSSNAILHAHKTLSEVGFQWRKDIHYFAIGKGSAEALSALAECATTYSCSQENSEGLLALPSMQKEKVENKTILVLRGNGGRELFPSIMQTRGAKIMTIECYQRLAIDNPNPIEQVDLWQRTGINQILITNQESLNYLLAFVPENEHNWLKNCQFITVSQRIADLAQQFGWQNIVIASHADNTTLLQTILATS